MTLNDWRHSHYLDAEEWRPIPGFPKYEASNFGRVRSLMSGHPRVMALQPRNGYWGVCLQVGGKAVARKAHQLVMLAFVGPRPEGQEVRHLDGDRTNNHLTNLAYGTRSENLRDAVAHGTHHWASKTHCPRGHAYDEANTNHYEGRRYCRSCNVIHKRNSDARKARGGVA